MKNEWQILGIEPTDNKRLIKKAYAKKLAQHHPEDAPEEFKEIQEAYTTIMQSLSRTYTSQDVSLNEAQILAALKKNARPLSFEETPLDTNTTKAQHKKEHPFSFEDTPHAMDASEDATAKTCKPKAKQIHAAKAYDKFNLREQFSKMDQQSSSAKQETTSSSNDPADSHMDAKAYSDFVEAKLKKKADKSTFVELILKHDFFERCKDATLYTQLCQLIIAYFPSFDSITISFLYDVFAALDQEHPDHPSHLSIPSFIQHEKEEKLKTEQRKARVHKLQFIFLPLIIVLITFLSLFLKNQKMEEPSYKTNQKTEDISDKGTKDLKQMQEDIAQFAEHALFERKNESYTCVVYTHLIEPASTVDASCKTANLDDEQNVSVLLGADRKPLMVMLITPEDTTK